MTPFHLRQATRILKSGGIVACPTEAVYGLSCDPLQQSAVERLLVIKQRGVAKGLILVASGIDQIPSFVSIPGNNRDVIVDSWPGPATWLLPARSDAPPWIRGDHNTIAMRVTAHPVMSALCESFGSCLVSTSANPAGMPPAKSPLQVQRQLGHQVDLILHAKLGTSPKPTTIRDAVTGNTIRG
ncbi:MAG: L-threonylcarbamoyladenylate synthase [Pseudomonadota bacterium]